MMKRAAASIAAVVFACEVNATSACAELRIATWNIETLTTDKPVVPDQYMRSAADLQVLRSHAETFTADVIALQEIASPAAAAQFFPVEQWIVCISGQFFESYPQLGESASAKCFSDSPLPDTPVEAPWAKQFTAFVVRKSRGLSVSVTDMPELGVVHRDPKDDTERTVRWGLVAKVGWAGSAVALLNVHLKSGCRSDHPWRIKRDSPQFPVCQTLGEQVRPLADFVRKAPAPFVVLGDFNRRMGPRDMLLMRLTGSHTPKNPHDDVALELHTAADRTQCSINPHAPIVDHFVLSSGLKGADLQVHALALPGAQDRRVFRQTFGDHCTISL